MCISAQYKYHIDQLLLFGSYLKDTEKLLFDRYTALLPSEDAFTKAFRIVERNKKNYWCVDKEN